MRKEARGDQSIGEANVGPFCAVRNVRLRRYLLCRSESASDVCSIILVMAMGARGVDGKSLRCRANLSPVVRTLVSDSRVSMQTPQARAFEEKVFVVSNRLDICNLGNNVKLRKLVPHVLLAPVGGQAIRRRRFPCSEASAPACPRGLAWRMSLARWLSVLRMLPLSPLTWL